VFQFFLCFPFSYLVFYHPSLFTFLSLKTHVSFISMLLKLFGNKSLDCWLAIFLGRSISLSLLFSFCLDLHGPGSGLYDFHVSLFRPGPK
jgi:hypothetical protein